MLKLYGKPLNSKNINKLFTKVVKNNYFTYFIAIVTLFFVSETLKSPNNSFLLNLKQLVDKTLIKFILLFTAIYIGYYNQTLGILLLINLFFLLNIREKIEFFANQIPNLVDKNKVLELEKNFKPARKKEPVKPKKKKKVITPDTKNTVKKQNKNAINNPIKIKESEKLTAKSNHEKEQELEKKITEEVEEVSKKITTEDIDSDDFTDTDDNESEISSKKRKLYQKYYEKHKNNKKKELDDKSFADKEDKKIINKESLQEHEKRKRKNKKYKEELIDELKKSESDQMEEDRVKIDSDKTLEAKIKSANVEKRKNLKILEDTDEEDSSSSESSDSSSSSESSSDSDKEYQDVSLSEAREYVLKKLRNKMKKDYVNNN
jgi:hypothetical protein